jgi:hypothetical protein
MAVLRGLIIVFFALTVLPYGAAPLVHESCCKKAVHGVHGFKERCVAPQVLGGVCSRVSTEFRQHGIPSVFFTSVYSVFRAELAKNSDGIPPNSVTYNSVKFRGISRYFFKYGIPYISSWNSFDRYHVPATAELLLLLLFIEPQTARHHQHVRA